MICSKHFFEMITLLINAEALPTPSELEIPQDLNPLRVCQCRKEAA